MTHSLQLADQAATESLAARLVAALPAVPAGWMLLLKGDLGSGKSTLARAMLREFGHRGTVPSPTYTLIEPYQFPEFSAYHVDLYRVSSLDELEYLGWSELEEGFRIVEWPERVAGLARMADVQVLLEYAGEGRSAVLTAGSDRGAELVQRLAEGTVSSMP